MAVPEGPTDKRYIGNGVTKTFTIPFLLLASTDLDVFIDGIEISSGFTVTNVGYPASNLTFAIAPADQADIFLQLDVPFERLNDYQENGDFLSSTVNRDFDRIWQALKQLLRWAGRSLRLGDFDLDGRGWYRAKGNGIRDLHDPVNAQDAVTKKYADELTHDTTQYTDAQILRTVRGGAAESLVQLPPVPVRANTVMGFDSAGNPIAVTPMTATEVDVALAQVFPGVILDHATTSWAKIKSADYTDDRAVDLANLLDMKKSVVIDTRVALNSAVPVLKDFAILQCSGDGILLNGPGMAQKSMLVVTGNHVTFDKMRMDNPAMLKSNTGTRQVAIQIKANYVSVLRSKFWRMLTSAACESQGEWYGTEFISNKAYECLGAGAGPEDDGAFNFGEDRGDAFVIWGASGKMLNNEAYCMAGQDARIAFHAEGLQILHPQPGGPNDDKDFIISGNFAGGAFRRHFAFESISRGIINNCISLGGATWWVIQVSGCKNVIVDSVIAKWDRKTVDQSGRAWSPDRAVIGILNGTDDVQFSNITARWAPGVDGGDGSIVRVSGSNVTYDFGRCRFDNIRATMNPDIRRTGMDLSILAKPYVSNSRVENALHSFASFDSGSDVTYERCASVNASANGFRSEGASKIRVKNSLIDGANGGITAGAATYADVQENTFRNITGQEIDLFMLDFPIIVKNNVAEDGGGLLRIRGLDSGTVAATAVRDIEGNVGFGGSLWRYAPATVASAGSKLNTDGKFDGKRVTGTDGNTYISQGITPTAPWAQITAKVTPA